MAASARGRCPRGRRVSSTRCITSVVVTDAAPTSRSSEVSAVITASASFGCRSIAGDGPAQHVVDALGGGVARGAPAG